MRPGAVKLNLNRVIFNIIFVGRRVSDLKRERLLRILQLKRHTGLVCPMTDVETSGALDLIAIGVAVETQLVGRVG